MSQSIPQRHRLDLEQAAHSQLVQAPISRLGVDALGGRGALLVDRLGLLGRHPRPPCRHRRTVTGLGGVPVYLRVSWLRHWCVHRAAFLRSLQRIDLIVLSKASVDQHFIWRGLVSFLDLFDHRHGLTSVAAGGLHVHSHDHLAARGRAELEVVRRAEAAVGHLHHGRDRVGCRAPRLAQVLGFLLGLQLRQPLQSLLDPLGALASGSLTGFLLPAILGPGVLVQLSPQRFNLRLGLCVRFLQGRTTAKRRGPGAGSDAHPVLGHSVQVDQSFGDQHRDVVSQQLVEQLDMPGTEIGEGVVVGAHIAGDPAESIMCAAQFVELTGAADSFECGVKPERHEDLGVDGGTSRRSLDGLDAVVQRAEVESFDKVPDDPGGMIERDQFIEGRSAKDDLLAVSGPQPRASSGGWSLGWRDLACGIGGNLEERWLFEATRLGIGGAFHNEIIAVWLSLDNTFWDNWRFFHRLSVGRGAVRTGELDRRTAMSKPFDATMRKLIELEASAGRLAAILAHSGRRSRSREGDRVKPLNITAEADKVLWVDDPRRWIEHIELQASRDARLVNRVQCYHSLLGYQYEVPVHSAVVLLRAEADGPELTGTFEKELPAMILGIRGIEESSVYQGIFAKGRAEGRAEEAREAVFRLGGKKLGQPSAQVRSKVDAIDDLDRLNTLLERILDVSSWDELLAAADLSA